MFLALQNYKKVNGNESDDFFGIVNFDTIKTVYVTKFNCVEIETTSSVFYVQEFNSLDAATEELKRIVRFLK